MKRKKLMRIGGMSAALLIGLFLILPQMAKADEDNSEQKVSAVAVAEETTASESVPVIEESVPAVEESAPVEEELIPASEPATEEPASEPENVGTPGTDVAAEKPVVVVEPVKAAETSEDSISPLADTINEGVDGVNIDGQVVTSYEGKGGNVSIPKDTTEIGSNAFYEATTVTSVEIPDTVTTIGSSAFNGCISLSEVSIPNSVTDIGEGAFANCTNLTSVAIPSTVETVSGGAFYNCSSLTEVSISNGTKNIEEGAFAECTSLTQVTIPSTVEAISTDAFSGDYSLTSITVEEGNPYYSSKAGCLYSADGTEFYYCPEGKTKVNLAGGVEVISSGSFSSAYYVEEVKLPSTTTTISDDAFAGSNVKKVTIPANVTYIGDQGDWVPDVIYGYSGTAAEEYALENGIIFVKLDGKKYDADNPNPADPDSEEYGANANGTSSVQSNSGETVTAAEHVKDDTPKTGVEDNPLYFLFIGLFLVGVAFIMGSKIERPGQEE